MGGCISSSIGDDTISDAPLTAKVISQSGELHEYDLPVRVRSVLESESSTSSPASSLFLCNSDMLCYDEHIPAIRADVALVSDQIYFVLPRSRLRQKLTASDMAGLAVKASVALQKANKKEVGKSKKRRTRISPVMEVGGKDYEEDQRHTFEVEEEEEVGLVKKSAAPAAGPPPVRKMMKSASGRRLKRAMRSFRIRLSTIHEENQQFV